LSENEWSELLGVAIAEPVIEEVEEQVTVAEIEESSEEDQGKAE
jgi:hypothetical protein